jgi:hypothetical protein
LITLAIWPNDAYRRHFAALYTDSANLLYLDHRIFGSSARARLNAESNEVRQPGRNVSHDAILELRVKGLSGVAKVGVSTRRDAFLPIMASLLILLLFAEKRKDFLTGLGLALLVPFVASLVSLDLLVRWLLIYEFRVNRVYELRGLHADFVDLAYRIVLAPPINRFLPGTLCTFFWVAICRTRRRSAHIRGLSGSHLRE